jgi:FHA domain
MRTLYHNNRQQEIEKERRGNQEKMREERRAPPSPLNGEHFLNCTLDVFPHVAYDIFSRDPGGVLVYVRCGMEKSQAADDKTRIRRPEPEKRTIPARYQASVVIVQGYAAGMEYPLAKESTVIGRDKSADIVLKDALVSREHVVIVYSEGTFILKDLESTNGTVLNGKLIQRADLRHRDKFRVGDTELQFILTDTDV